MLRQTALAFSALFRNCNPHPVPFVLIASTTDETNPYAGAPGTELTRFSDFDGGADA